MTLLRALAALGLAACSLTLPTSAAHAVATRQGQPATIEGTSGALAGTTGPDVIVVMGNVERVDAGEGDDLICVVDNASQPGRYSTLVVDAGAGDDVVDTTSAAARSNTTLGLGSDTFLGGPMTDVVLLGDQSATDVDQVSTGAGKDHLSAANVAVGPSGTFDLGDGRDSVAVRDDYDFPGASGRTSLTVDLLAESMTWRGATSVLRGVEDVDGLARRVVLRGDAERNRMTAMGCQVTLAGRAGNDRLSMRVSHSLDEQPFRCGTDGKTGSWRALGHRGDDYLHGGNQHDVLVGGPGTDVADGWKNGRDRCDAERIKGRGCGVPN